MEAGSADTRAPRRGASPVTGVAALLGIAGAVFAEVLIAALVAVTHPSAAFAVLTVVCAAISSLIAFAFDRETTGEGAAGPLLVRVQSWIARHRDAASSKFGRLLGLSEGIAFVILSVTAGPFITTLALKLRGVTARTAYTLSLASSALFSACWVALYSGVFAAFGIVWDRLA